MNTASHNHRPYLQAGAFLALSAIVLGAMGAHALEKIFTHEQLESFETAVRYQFYGALSLLVLSALKDVLPLKKWIFISLGTGTVLFSGSIYALVSLPSEAALRSVLGPITPVGGTLMIAAWIGVLIATFKR